MFYVALCAHSSYVLDGYLAHVVEHDMQEAGREVRRPATVSSWLRAYAAATGTATSWEKIRHAATSSTGTTPARSTSLPYVDVLTSLRILDPLPASWVLPQTHC